MAKVKGFSPKDALLSEVKKVVTEKGFAQVEDACMTLVRYAEIQMLFGHGRRGLCRGSKEYLQLVAKAARASWRYLGAMDEFAKCFDELKKLSKKYEFVQEVEDVE
jgi:hypothetical protein